MRLLWVLVITGVAARASAAPAFDAKDIANLDAAVPALVADKTDCAKVGKHAVVVADLLGKIAAGKPATAGVVTSDVGPRLLRHAVAVQAALTGPCLQTLDKQLVTRLARGMARAPASVAAIPKPAHDIDRDYTKPPAPQPIPAEQQQLLDLFDFYLRVAIATDPERPTVLFLRANLLRRHSHLDKAIAIFLEIIDKHPKHEVAEYAANLALDAYNRLQKYDELVALAKRLHDTPGFLDKRTDLRDTTDKILRQSSRRTAEQCEARAKATRDREAYGKCAEHYVALYNANPNAADIDEMLYNAAVLYSEARSIGAALQMYALMQRHAPSSRLLPRALARRGHLFSQIGMFTEAAAILEEYATKYAGERDAYQALSDAFFYRRALGDTARATHVARSYQRLFGQKKPAEAAAVQLALVALAEEANDDAALVAQTTEYLKLYGHRDPNAKLVVAVKRGQSAWRRSCPIAGTDGLCIEYTRPRAAGRNPASCGPATVKVRVVARKPALVQEALRDFKAAIAIADRSAPLDVGAQYAAMMARIAIADVELEAALGGTAPTDAKALGPWLVEQQKKIEPALQQYARGTQLPALARVALAHQLFGDALLALEVPAALRSRPATYCDPIVAAVAPVQQRAITALAACSTAAKDANVVDAWSRSCQRGLAALAPQKAPAVLVEPVLAPQVARIPVQLEPPVTVANPLFDEFRRREGKWTAAHCDRVGKQLLAAATGADRATVAYMAGLAFHRCNNVVEAERAYRTAGAHGRSLSNLGAIAAAAGKPDAKQLWADALKTDGKLFAARVNIAAFQLDDLRKLPVKDAAWKKLADDIQFHLSNALAIDADSVAARVAYALLYFEGLERSKARLEIGKLVLRELEDATPRDPAASNALAIYAWRRGQTSVAYDLWKSAGKDANAALNLALASLAIGKLSEAKAQLSAHKPAAMLEYDHALALGVAHRGLSDQTAADAAYQKAIRIDAARPEAYFAIGALHEQIATRMTDVKAKLAAFQRAAEHYRKAADRASGALKANAQAAATEADQAITALQP